MFLNIHFFHISDLADDATESLDLITQREKIQQQILALEKYFDAEGNPGLSACSSTGEFQKVPYTDLCEWDLGDKVSCISCSC